MRTLLFLYVSVIFGFTPINVLSQNPEIYIESESTLTVDEVLELIMKQTDYKFIYQESLFKDFPKVNVKKGIQPANDLLNKSLSNGDFEIKLEANNTVVVKKNTKKRKQQQIIISGEVLDEVNMPLPGASVVEKGTSNGVTTDIDGKFTFSVTNDTSTILVSYLGYSTKEITLSGETNLSIKLDVDAAGLDEIVVVGYGRKKKSELSSSVSIISEEEIQSSVSSTSIQDVLQGRVPGMQVSGSSGDPGVSASMVIQGMGSLEANSSPLTVVDGIIGGQYDPKDVKSISILRDAAATGLYGSRAANGVIVITTKDGKAGEFKVSVNSTFGPTSNWDDRVEVYDAEGLYNQWSTGMENLYNLRVSEGNPDFTSKTFEEYRNSVVPESALDYTSDWTDLLLRTGFLNQTQVSMSGGSERTTFYFSGSFNEEEGVALDTYNNQYNFRGNLSHKISDKLKTNIRMTAQYGEKSEFNWPSPYTQAYQNVPLDAAYMPDGVTPTPAMDLEQVPVWYRGTGVNYMMEREESENSKKYWGATLMFELDYEITDWARFNTSNRVELNGSDHSKSYSNMTWVGYNYDGYMEWIYSYGLGVITSNTLHLNKSFGNHNLNGILGQEYNYDQSRFVNAVGTGIVGDMTALSSVGSARSVGGDLDETGFLSYFAQLDYDYKNKYYLVGSFRRDASSVFGEKDRWGTFYSIGGSWMINKENILSNSKSWLNLLKLRLSYGTTGNANIESYLSMGTYSFTSSSSYNGGAGAWPSRLPNPDLTWETARKLNLGIDVSVFDRVSLEVNFYNRINDDLLQSVPLEATTGFTSQVRNIGSIQNQGIDLSLTTTNIEGEFSWKSNFNFNINRNEVLELDGGEDIIDNGMIIREGHSLRSFYLPEYQGVDSQTGAPIYTRWEDAEGNKINGNDTDSPAVVTTTNYQSEASYITTSSAYPKMTGGFANYFKYKNFHLNILTNFAIGQTVYNYVDWNASDFNTNRFKLTDWQDLTRWENPGDNADIPQLMYGDIYNFSGTSSFYLEDASYLKIQKVSIGYTFPKTFLGVFKDFTINASVENLAIITGYSFGDSDVSFENPYTDSSRFRPTRKFLLNLNFSF
ncbi:SusC/RagA family TonB-linked outer membrane protein [Formosa sp. 4Alg 33]|uniref:SusC/RagA family TonB-linked outer membrane protein n=1 Tax=Formosa sp. 4Alg 33 TaxID=3382189 RepID=UPI003D9C55ED